MRNYWRLPVGLLLLIGLVVIIMHIQAENDRQHEDEYLAKLNKNITLSSNSFPPNGDLPKDCSCQGKGISPALFWESNRTSAKSYVILMSDYDVPTPAFSLFDLSHWVVYNLPGSVHSIPEAVSSEQMQLLGGKIGKNSKGNLAFMAACPPAGRHAYVFRIYALDQLLSFVMVPDKRTLLETIRGHVVGYGELTGYFQY